MVFAVQRPINLNVSPHSLFVPISNAHIYPSVHVPIVKSSTIKEIATHVPKKFLGYTEKYVLPYHHLLDKGIVQHKKPPLFVQIPTIKNVVFHHTNWVRPTSTVQHHVRRTARE